MRYASSLVFFFFSHRYLRALPSFPTRRSSDLLLRQLPVVHPADVFFLLLDVLALGLPLLQFQLVALLTQWEAQREYIEKDRKSTPELQSHSDLVCRLLLEKKKKQTKNMKPSYY